MATEWSNEKVLAFLEILQTEPCLWDPSLKSFKNRGTQRDAWRRIIEMMPFETTIEAMKKKKESLMGYYRTHLHKMKKSLKSGAGKDEVYTTNWFAFETMDSFLREVYENSRTMNTETHDDNETETRSEGETDENERSPHLSMKTKRSSQIIEAESDSRPREYKSSQNYSRKRQKDDEYEIFGRLITSKLKKMINPNSRDILMNDIHNLVFRTCMEDRLEQESAVPQYTTVALSPNSPSSNSSS